MVTRNLFRFVSVRPPISAAGDDDCRLINEEVGAQLLEEVALRREEGESLSAARRNVALAIIQGGIYFTVSETWAHLRPLREQVQASIREFCEREERPEEGPEFAVGDEFSGWAGEESDPFDTAKRILWRSYYANVLVPELRPNDRPEMLEWIRILAAIERLRPSSEKASRAHDLEACACIERLSRARVHMPHELFAETPPPEPVPVAPEDTLEDNVTSVRASLARLESARRDLDRLYLHKLSRLRLATSPDPGPRSDAVDAGRPVSDYGTDVPADDEGAMHPPWVLTEEDATQLPEVDRELDRRGVPLAGSLVPDVAAVLDEAIAARTEILASLESRVDVLGFGQTAALVRRATRVLRSGSDEAGAR